MKKTLRTRIAAALSIVALSAGTALVAAPAQAADDVCYPGMFTCKGDLGSGLGKYEVTVPGNFNGTMLLFFHGIRLGKGSPVLQSLKAAGIDYSSNPNYTAVTVPGLGDAWIGNGNVEASPDPKITAALLQKGYAVAGLGYGDNQGWAVQEAQAAGAAFIKKARAGYVWDLQRVILWSQSMGGLPALNLAENNTGVNAILSACTIAPSTNTLFAQALDAMFVLKTLGGLDLKLTYPAGPAGLAAAYGDLNTTLTFLGGIRANANALASTGLLARNVVLLAGLVAGLPEASANFDGITTGGPIAASQLSSISAMAENIGSAAVFATIARFEVESRIRVAGSLATGSANFTDNVNVSYTDLLSDEQRAQYETFLNLGGTEVLDKMLALLDASKGNDKVRLAANPAAVTAANTVFASWKGKPRVPTLLLGYEVDNLTQAGEVARYVNAAKKFAKPTKVKKGKKTITVPARTLVQALYADAPDDGWTVLGDATATAAKRTSGVGHCGGSSSLTGVQLINAVDALNTWVVKGDKAGTAAINAVRSNAALGFVTDSDYEPTLPKR